MGSAGVARLVWPGVILFGLLLAAFVWAAWPAGGAARAPVEAQPAAATATTAGTPAAVEPEPSAGLGPAPVPSELELGADYVQESPEELGAAPLPGVVVTPEPAPVVG